MIIQGRDLSKTELVEVHSLMGPHTFSEGFVDEEYESFGFVGTDNDELDDEDDSFSYEDEGLYERHELLFDPTKATKVYLDDVFSPLVYHLPNEEILFASPYEYSDYDSYNQTQELYKYVGNNPYYASRILRPTGAPTNIQILDFSAPNIREADRNHTNIAAVFEDIAKYLGIKAPEVQDAVVDHQCGIDVFLIPNNAHTNELGLFKDVDGTQLGGYAFTQANGRYAIAIKNTAINRYIAAHEFGHVLDYVAGGTNEATTFIPDKVMESAGLTKEDITWYGATKDSELFAEVFAIASLELAVRQITHQDGAKHVQITQNVSAEERLLAIIRGELKFKDDFSKGIHAKYHDLIKLLLKDSMPTVSAAVQKSKRRMLARNR